MGKLLQMPEETPAEKLDKILKDFMQSPEWARLWAMGRAEATENAYLLGMKKATEEIQGIAQRLWNTEV